MGGHVSVVDKRAHKTLTRISLWNIDTVIAQRRSAPLH